MWEFLSTVFESGGTTALLFVGNILAFLAAIRYLLHRNTALVDELRRLQEEHRKEVAALQEKRVEEAQEVARVVVQHVESTKTSVDRVRSAMETLTDVMSGRR